MQVPPWVISHFAPGEAFVSVKRAGGGGKGHNRLVHTQMKS